MLIAILLIVAAVPAYTKSGEVTEYTLSNGLKLIVKEDHRAPIVISQVWYKVGSSYESTGITGISHALEHMMFKGTKKYGMGALDKIIVDNGGKHNASTSEDYTWYYAEISADKLPIVFDLEADRMQGLLLDENEFAKEQQVIIEERKMRIEDNPNALARERFVAAAYVSNPYRTPVIGWMNDIKSLTVADLKSWYRNWYAPNNAIVVVVGDVQPAAVFKLAQQYFGPLPKVDIAKTKPQKEVDHLGKRSVIVRAKAKLPHLFMGYNVDVLKTADQKWKAYALDVIQGVLSSGSSARLDKDLVRGKQIAASVYAYYNLYSRLDNLFVLGATPTPGHTISELRTALLQQIKKLHTTLVTSEELERIQAQIISNKVYAKDFIQEQGYDIGSLETVGLSWKAADQYVQNIKAVTPEQIQQVANEYLTQDRLTVTELQIINDQY